jgi:hypothetical protein
MKVPDEVCNLDRVGSNARSPSLRQRLMETWIIRFTIRNRALDERERTL